MLAASVSAWAQTTPQPKSGGTGADQVLPTVEVKASRENESKESFRATTTTIGKGNQELRDVPQSVTVITERLMSDRNLDDFRDVLRNTAGVTFQAGETGEEDIRLRGFSLGQAGDIYSDGMRDGTLYERDTFNVDRIDVLKGSASMLFGKGSTGGVVNQVSKQPFLTNQNEVSYTVGTGQDNRLTGDFNVVTGENAAFRLNAMVQDADNWGAEQKKQGVAPTFSWGIGTRDEFSVGLYYLESDGRPLYNHPWVINNGHIVETVPAKNYYGLASDHLNTSATYGTIAYTHRFDQNSQLKTQLRHGRYERDLLASAVGFCNGVTGNASQRAACPGQQIVRLDQVNDNTVLSRAPKGRIGVSDTTQLTSDYSGNFIWGGLKHELLTGVDFYQEDAKRNNAFTTGLTFPFTKVGTPNDGATVADTRGNPAFNTFDARDIGLYVQDMVSIAPTVKLLGGLRFDRFTASYQTPTGTSNERSDNLWSPRVGALYQPSNWASYYVSYGTSYNTSGDAYQFTPTFGNDQRTAANTPPEKSRNFEVGGKWDLFENRASLGVAAFYSEKYNERNLDPDTASTQQLLSGKRHAAGMEFNLAGRITPKWEVFFNHTWIPDAKIDESNQVLAANGGGAQVKGDRPGLTPKNSGSLWTTYLVMPKLRLGAGLTYRGEQNPEGSRAVTADSFVVADAMAEYTIDQTWSAKLYVSNLTDKLYADTLYRGFYAPGSPRRVQLTLKAAF
ncbi:TonB-dependent siderophore receptor [Noviherbaspirillum cavernae]|uniref:TonB-dependent siderophore receptor n=2 Tax=Noviherbaspirillum cavernae TaxID=2320862 RepID=A0A418X6D4_9BURK|nr:TonB-dependent siderophore receptor [Noviherbaspirillum cavernae]RJG08015.1 TonB-dependent siderophore receptor [Noviherbaspirillum cavernae]